jgi:hypothetical protein
VILAGRTLTTDERGLGIVIFRAPSADAARAIMEGDPAVRQGVMRAELFPFRVASGIPGRGASAPGATCATPLESLLTLWRPAQALFCVGRTLDVYLNQTKRGSTDKSTLPP